MDYTIQDSKKNKDLRFFLQIMSAFNSPLDLPELLKTICIGIDDEIGIKACQFMKFNRQSMQFENIESSGLNDAFIKDFSPDVGDDFLNGFQIMDYQAQTISEYVILGKENTYVNEGITSLLTIALHRDSKLVGILNLYDDKKIDLNKKQILTLKTITQFSTKVIINWIFNTTLQEVTKTVHSSLDVDEVIGSIVTVVTQKLLVKGCTIRLLDQNQNTFQLKAACGLSKEYLNKGPVMAKRSISQVLDGKCVAIFDAANDDRLQYPDAAIKEGIGSILSVPLIIYKNIIGDLRVYTHKPYEFGENEINLMMAVGEQCALAIRDARMYTGIKRKYDDLISDFHQWFDVDTQA